MNNTAPHKNSPLILVVDDDKFMRIQLRRAMEQAGYQVAEASDGQQGLAAYTRLHPDIVLLDALMPVMDGFTCCSLLHKLPEGDRTPVLMITALEDQESVDRAFEAGAIDYITKPIHWAVLRQRMRRLLQASWATEELRQQIQRTQTSEERLRLALDAAHMYTWDWDILSGKVVYSLTTEANLGLAPGTFDGTYESFLTSVHPEDRELLTQAVHNAVENKADLDIEFRVIWSDGSIHWAASKGQVYYDQTGKAVRMLGINMDITEKKQLQRQFLRAQRMESIGTLASGIAHDLNNVLAPIMMSVQLLAENNHDEQSQWLLPILETNIQRAADLVKQVLTFARGLEGARTTLQIRHLISEIKHIVKETFPKSIEFRTALETLDLWAVRGDATQLHQVLMNLVVNARDAMPNGGLLTISAENFYVDENYTRMHLDAKVGPYVVITVADTGTGIPPEILDRIFEPFFTTKEFGKGTGLGLSTVIGIVKGHGGFVNVYSEVGKGTQFKVYLPAVLSSETQQVSGLEMPTGHGELILVVDDEAAIREVTKTSLETYAYRVLTASDGIEAVALYVQHQEEISVVLVDMMMPSMDGPTTIRTLQKINPQVKIIAVSGLTSSDRVAEVTRIGVKTFLSKPYTTEQLLKTLQGVFIST